MVLDFLCGWWVNIKSLSFLQWAIIVFIAFMVYVMIYGESVNSYSMHMQECIADGHKGYECRGILEGGRGGR